MIYLVGDIHGVIDINKVITYFQEEKNHQEITKKDYLILLGDTNICWDNGIKDKEVMDILQSLPLTILFIDGNHENFTLLNSYPVTIWNGGNVHLLEGGIIHLMRGQIFTIENKKFFTFGGGNSIDKNYRKENINWWPDEMPNDQEYSDGMVNLMENNFQVDYILTHTIPSQLVIDLLKINSSGEEALQDYLQEVADITTFRKWYFGHWHKDINISNMYIGLWNDIVVLE